MDTVTHWITQYGYGGLYVLLALGIVGVPVPDETLLTFTGFLVYRGQMHGAVALATAWAGSVTGITLSYLLGHFLGGWLIHRYGWWVHLTPQRMERVHAWFEHHGKWTLLFGYYVPGFRHVTAYAAGMACMRYWVFGVFAYGGALIWASTFLLLGYLLGPQWQTVVEYVEHGHAYVLYLTVLAAAIVAVVWIVGRVRGRPAG